MGLEFDIKDWSMRFLFTSKGINVLEYQTHTDEEKLTGLTIIQRTSSSVADLNTFRHHKIDLTIFDKDWVPTSINNVVIEQHEQSLKFV